MTVRSFACALLFALTAFLGASPAAGQETSSGNSGDASSRETSFWKPLSEGHWANGGTARLWGGDLDTGLWMTGGTQVARHVFAGGRLLVATGPGDEVVPGDDGSLMTVEGYDYIWELAPLVGVIYRTERLHFSVATGGGLTLLNTYGEPTIYEPSIPLHAEAIAVLLPPIGIGVHGVAGFTRRSTYYGIGGAVHFIEAPSSMVRPFTPPAVSISAMTGTMSGEPDVSLALSGGTSLNRYVFVGGRLMRGEEVETFLLFPASSEGLIQDIAPFVALTLQSHAGQLLLGAGPALTAVNNRREDRWTYVPGLALQAEAMISPAQQVRIGFQAVGNVNGERSHVGGGLSMQFLLF